MMKYLFRPIESRVILAMPATDETSVENLTAKAGLTPTELLSALQTLENRELVNEVDKGYFQLTQTGATARRAVGHEHLESTAPVFLLEEEPADVESRSEEEVNAALDELLGPVDTHDQEGQGEVLA